MYQFSYFKKPVSNKKPEKIVSLQEVFDIVRTQFKTVTTEYRKFKDRKFKERNFDFVTFHGVFTTRADNGLVEDGLSGLFVADLDHLADLAGTHDELVSDKKYQPALIFISPSGEGLKVVYKIPLEGVDLTARSRRMGRVRDTLNAHYAENYKIKVTPDNSGSDVSRNCFLCYDPTAYYNPDAEEIVLIAQVKKEKANRVLTIDDLVKKHLLPENNRTNELVAFIAA